MLETNLVKSRISMVMLIPLHCIRMVIPGIISDETEALLLYESQAWAFGHISLIDCVFVYFWGWGWVVGWDWGWGTTNQFIIMVGMGEPLPGCSELQLPCQCGMEHGGGLLVGRPQLASFCSFDHELVKTESTAQNHW